MSNQPLFPSQNPVSLIQDGLTQVYNQWGITRVQAISINNGQKVSLQVSFKLFGLDEKGNTVSLAQNTPVTFKIDDILTDSNLGASISAFFQALVTEAMTQGAIS